MDKKVIGDKMKQMQKNLQKAADKEIARAKQHMDKTAKQVEDFVKKNPEKAAAISAGIGAALGAAAAMLFKGTSKGGKKKK